MRLPVGASAASGADARASGEGSPERRRLVLWTQAQRLPLHADTHRGFRARSRRGWAMAELVPELARAPNGLMLDGELVNVPLVCMSQSVPLAHGSAI